MKIAITVQKNDPDSPLDQRFGRAAGFLFYDPKIELFSYEDNTQNLQSQQGAGIQTAQMIIDAGANVVISGNVGPKAFAALQAAGIDVYTAASGTARSVIEDFGSGKLEKVQGATKGARW